MEAANVWSYGWVWMCMRGVCSLCFSILHPLSSLQYHLDLLAICPPTSIQKITEPHFSGDHYAPLSNSWLSTNIVISLENEVKHLWRMVDLTLAQPACSLWGFISSLPKSLQGSNRSEIMLLQSPTSTEKNKKKKRKKENNELLKSKPKQIVQKQSMNCNKYPFSCVLYKSKYLKWL